LRPSGDGAKREYSRQYTVCREYESEWLRGNGDNYRFRPKTAPDDTAIERQIAATDQQIDALVVRL
jgi:hypothetical protein